MNIGIDASNIRTGGGRKHLEDFIIYSSTLYDNLKFTIVSNKTINDSFANFNNVECKSNKLLNINNLTSFLSQVIYSKKYFKNSKCDIVFVPGGIFLSTFRPYITMSQNMLPFDYEEILKFNFSKRIKFFLIKIFQLRTFKESKGIIFLTKYAQNTIFKSGNFDKKSIIIPHGIKQREINLYQCKTKPFEILYVSDFLPYKNQFKVVQAINNLINKGHDINLKLIGRVDKEQLREINKLTYKNELLTNRLQIFGYKSNKEILDHYNKCSIFLFASTCENLPFILLEAMSFGLPILTTIKKPMCDIVYNKGVLFDVNNPSSIEKTIVDNLDKGRLLKISEQNFNLSKHYIIEESVKKSIDFISTNI